jgi:uroporphyrin-III C-methyltransferase
MRLRSESGISLRSGFVCPKYEEFRMSENNHEYSQFTDRSGRSDDAVPEVAYGRVFLVGAGPGDPDLLTIKAAKALASSDVVLYDDLVNPRVLFNARACSELVDCGKRAGRGGMSQTEINALMIWHALQGRTVTRLKGGDPFVFGRGGEEAEALVEAGIPWEVIPGVSSGVAAAAYAGIPLTHREHSSSVAFVTGHDSAAKRRGPVKWTSAAHTADTLVIFMCARTVGTIAAELVAGGRAASTPVAIVHKGTWEEEQRVFAGTLGELVEVAEVAAETGGPLFEAPAIAIVGEVVSLSEKLHWFGERAYALTDAGRLRDLAAAEVG